MPLDGISDQPLAKFLIDLHFQIKQSGKYNFQGLHVPLPSKFNFPFIEKCLEGYRDKIVVDFLKFSFPIDCSPPATNPGVPNNHAGARDFPIEISKILLRETRLGGTLGPFDSNPFPDARFSPLNSVPKRETEERRMILDLSFPRGAPINDGIQKDVYLGVEEKLVLPSIDTLVEHVVRLGKGCKVLKLIWPGVINSSL